MACRHVLTGSYHNYFRIYDADTLNDVVLQADKSAFKAKKTGGPIPGNKMGSKNGRTSASGLRENMAVETLDFNKKILHASWHPRENTIAVRGPVANYPFCADVGSASDRCNKQPVLVQRSMNSPRRKLPRPSFHNLSLLHTTSYCIFLHICSRTHAHYPHHTNIPHLPILHPAARVLSAVQIGQKNRTDRHETAPHDRTKAMPRLTF